VPVQAPVLFARCGTNAAADRFPALIGYCADRPEGQHAGDDDGADPQRDGSPFDGAPGMPGQLHGLSVESPCCRRGHHRLNLQDSGERLPCDLRRHTRSILP
jgi:hypothetical protein